MKTLFLILLPILAQLSTPTPAPTVTPIPYIEETPSAPMLPDNVIIGDNQIYFAGRPVLPAESGGMLFAYGKWLFGSGAAAAFGPFAPLILHVATIIIIFMMLLSIWIVQQIFSLAARFFLWGIRFVRGGG